MRILIIAHFAGSPRHGMVFGHYHLAREWVKRGHQVTIAAASFAHTRYRQPEASGLVAEETLDGIRYLWLRVPGYSARSKIGRVVNILAFTMMTWLMRSRMGQPDAVVLSSHHPLPAFAARSIARRAGARLIFEVRDLWPLTLIELGGASPGNPLIRLMQRAEDFAYANADAVVCVLGHARDYMVQHGLREDKLVYIPNGIDPESCTPEPLPEGHRARLAALKAEGRRLIGYAGRIGLANALDPGVLSLRYVADPRWTFVVLGHGPYRDGLEELARKEGLTDRLVVLEPVSQQQSAEFLRHVDIAYLGLVDKPLFRYGISSTKLNDYLFAAKPVVCAVPGRIDALEASGAGVLCRPGDPRAIAAAIDQLAALPPDELAALGQAGRAWLLANRRYEDLAARFLDVLGDRSSAHPPTANSRSHSATL